MTFTCSSPTATTIVLKVQSSDDLRAATCSGAAAQAEVPDASDTVNGIDLVVIPNADPDLINVRATIPLPPGSKLFGRLSAVAN